RANVFASVRHDPRARHVEHELRARLTQLEREHRHGDEHAREHDMNDSHAASLPGSGPDALAEDVAVGRPTRDDEVLAFAHSQLGATGLFGRSPHAPHAVVRTRTWTTSSSVP